jgi:sialic acid synthase SpsE
MLETPQNYSVPALEVIAEAGCNHGGDMGTAIEMVNIARTCGATTIKFQSFVPEKLVNADDVLEWCKKSQMTYQEHALIIDECENEGIKPLFSAFDIESLEMMSTLGMDEVKIPSGQIFNHDLLKEAGIHMRRVYLSTGMCCMKDVDNAVNILMAPGRLKSDQLVVMQCTTAYPAPLHDACLLVLERYREKYHTFVGYSDHTPGYTAAIAAVALGATVIEKHFILNFKTETPDACVSLNPVEFRMMVNHLHEALAVRGTHIKRPRQSEKKMFKRRDYGDRNE